MYCKVIATCHWVSGCLCLHCLPSLSLTPTPHKFREANTLSVYLSTYSCLLPGCLAPNCCSGYPCRRNELTLPWWIYYPHWRYQAAGVKTPSNRPASAGTQVLLTPSLSAPLSYPSGTHRFSKQTTLCRKSETLSPGSHTANRSGESDF